MVHSADQSLRLLERQALQRPEDLAILRSLAQAYHRQDRLSDAVKTLHRGSLFHENDPVAHAISHELKTLQRTTLQKLGPYVSCCSWSERKNQKEWISTEKIDEETPVIVGLTIFWLNELSVLRQSLDIQLWLQSLHCIFPSQNDQAFINWITTLPYLSELSIRLDQLDHAALQDLRSIPALRDLELIVDKETTEKLFEDRAFLSKLRSFSFEGQLNQELIAFNKLTTLQHLKLTLQRNAAESLDFIFPSQLRSLQLNKIDAFSRISLNSLSTLTSLESLSLDFSSSEDRGMNLLSSFPNLSEASINSIHTPERLASLPKPERLKKLNLQYSPITERHLSTLQKFQGLEDLSFHEGGMSSLTIDRLKKSLPVLKSVNIQSDRSPI